MTNHEKRIVIAEFCGWKKKRCSHGVLVHWHSLDWRGPKNEVQMPDFLNNLNAIHEAEKKINVADYVRNLRQIVGWCGESDEDIEDDWVLITATAMQRAEAVLTTIGKRP